MAKGLALGLGLMGAIGCADDVKIRSVDPDNADRHEADARMADAGVRDAVLADALIPDAQLPDAHIDPNPIATFCDTPLDQRMCVPETPIPILTLGNSDLMIVTLDTLERARGILQTAVESEGIYNHPGYEFGPPWDYAVHSTDPNGDEAFITFDCGGSSIGVSSRDEFGLDRCDEVRWYTDDAGNYVLWAAAERNSRCADGDVFPFAAIEVNTSCNGEKAEMILHDYVENIETTGSLPRDEAMGLGLHIHQQVNDLMLLYGYPLEREEE